MLRAIVSVLLGLTVMMPGIPMSAGQWLTHYASADAGSAGEAQASHVVENTTPRVHSAVETPSTTATTVAVADDGYTEWTNDAGTSVEWKLDADGTLHVEPLNGNVGTIDASHDTAPWRQGQRDQIRKVVTEKGTIKLIGEATLFMNCTNLADISGLAHWDTSGLTNMSDMFAYCKFLRSLQPLSGWNTSKVQSMAEAFRDCGLLTDVSALARWDTRSVTNMYYLFLDDAFLMDISGLRNWNTANLKNMEGMLQDCTMIRDLTPLSNWNTSNVEDMHGTFSGCAQITDLAPLSGWKTSRVTDMRMMFYNCSGIGNVDALKNWDTSHVTNMSYMFESASNLNNLSGLRNWNTASVTTMAEMFYSCGYLRDSSAIAQWDVGKVTSFNFMFWGDTMLNRIGVPAGSKGGAAFVRDNADYFQQAMPVFIDEGRTLPAKQTSWAKLAVNNGQGMVYVPYVGSFTVAFNANGGSGSQDPVAASAPNFDAVTLPYTMYFRFGYRFKGWTTQPGAVNASNPLMTAGYRYTRPSSASKSDDVNVTLYARGRRSARRAARAAPRAQACCRGGPR